MNKLRRIVFALLFALWLPRAMATVGESEVFVFDTRDSVSTVAAESAAFVLDTRESNATTFAESAVFAFDTRAHDGLSGFAKSGTFVLDTRGGGGAPSGLSIVGPAGVTVGTSAEYRVAYGAGGTTNDVTVRSTLAFVGGPPTWAGIGGTTLFVNRNAPVGTLTLQATWRHEGGWMLSAPLVVTVGKFLRTGMSATAQWTSGTSYTATLTGFASGGLPPYTFRWDTDGNGTYGDKTGSPATFTFTSNGGTRALALEVIDGNGARAYAKGSVTVDKPPVANEPPRLKPTADIGYGEVFDANGNPFAFDAEQIARVQNGCVVITHGILSQALGTGDDSWLQDMADRIESRTAAAGKPNVVLFDWREDSDPRSELNPTALAALDVLSQIYTGLGLVNAAQAGLDALTVALVRTAVASVLSAAAEQLAGIPLNAKGVAIATDFTIGTVTIRNALAPAHGQVLATWIWLNANNGLIDPDKPVHLIGHSAGGFVMGECALWLKQHPLPNGKIIWPDRVTMLDTPFPVRAHLKNLPDPNTVERFVSSLYGSLQFPTTWSLLPNQYRHLDVLGSDWALRLAPGDTGHGLSHVWYRWTIDPRADDPEEVTGFGVPGFAQSPIVVPGNMVPRGPAPLAAFGSAALAANGGGSAPVSGFTTFGSAVFQNDLYTLTEQTNAGITKMLTLPIGTEALTFRFKFAAAGDGDFLQVRFGDDYPLYVGLDTALSRDGFTEIEVPIEGLDGKTAALTFTLISRGAANAVAELGNICLVTGEDPDNDGLATVIEQGLGTDPLDPDSDGDGLSDGDEYNTTLTDALAADTDGDGLSDGAEITAGTNPLDSASTFTIRDVLLNGDGTVTLRWNAESGRTYRVLRSLTPDFTEFDVITSGVAAVVPLTSYTDSSVDPLIVPAAFYRVQVE